MDERTVLCCSAPQVKSGITAFNLPDDTQYVLLYQFSLPLLFVSFFLKEYYRKKSLIIERWAGLAHEQYISIAAVWEISLYSFSVLLVSEHHSRILIVLCCWFFHLDYRFGLYLKLFLLYIIFLIVQKLS